jgi:uncharacterized protein YecE (DUF72 family)
VALYAGTSGFSYPSWRVGFYPADARPEELLRHYAARLPAVELHGAFRRLPPAEQFRRWAEQTPPGFRFAVKLWGRAAAGAAGAASLFAERARLLGDRLGPVLVQLPEGRKRDDRALAGLLDTLAVPVACAVELEDPSWEDPAVDGVIAAAGAVRVGRLDWDGDAPLRYLRLREPPYDDEALEALAARVAPLVARGLDIYCFFRHEDEPRGALSAERLLTLV